MSDRGTPEHSSDPRWPASREDASSGAPAAFPGYPGYPVVPVAPDVPLSGDPAQAAAGHPPGGSGSAAYPAHLGAPAYPALPYGALGYPPQPYGPPGYPAHPYGAPGYPPHPYGAPGYPPHPYGAPGYPPPPTAPGNSGGGEGRRRSGIIGGLITGSLLFFKYGLALLKFGKFGATFVSMAVALFFYALIFGWQFGLGVVLLIFVHEMGHFGASKALGVPVTAPLFIPMLGAFTTHKNLESDRRKEAIIAIAGPVTGFFATGLIFLVALSATSVTHWVGLLLALSYFGFFITLFNLIPMVPLDGGRVAGAVSLWANVLGLAVFVGLVVFMLGTQLATNPFLIIMLLFGAYTTWHRYQRHRRGEEPPLLDPSARVWIASAYIALVAASALAMSLAHGVLINNGFVR